MVNLNIIASMFFNKILEEAKEIALVEFLEKYPELSLRGIGESKLMVQKIEYVVLKLGDGEFQLPDVLKREYDSLVENEAYNLIVKIVENTKERKND